MKHVETREELIELLLRFDKEAEKDWFCNRDETLIIGEAMYEGKVHSARYLACDDENNYCYDDVICNMCNVAYLYIDNEHMCRYDSRSLSALKKAIKP